MGATEEQLSAVEHAEYAEFDEAWSAAFRYADAMTPTPGVVPSTTYHALAAHWAPAQIVEITSVIAMFNFFNRFAHALDIPITR